MNKTWKILNDIAQLEQIQKESKHKKQVLFKHSTSCGISQYAYEKLETNWNFSEVEFDFYYLDLLRFRTISDAVASEWKINHQSPQIIVIDKGIVSYTCSHHKISAENLKENI
jgi:bacillithiol system protein YtxJ